MPLPFFVYFGLPKAGSITTHALKIPFLNRIAPFLLQSHHLKRSGFIFFIWALLILSASGPQWLGKPILSREIGRNIMLAVDLSGSMQIPDMVLDEKKVDRLTMVKVVASDFIQSRFGDRFGLILFGTHAYLQTPLTFDLKTVENRLNHSSIGLAGQRTAIGDAIGLAIKHLQNEKSKILILLTDGVANAGQVFPIEAAKRASKAGIRIYTIGIGAESLAVPGLFGMRQVDPSMDLDEKTLKSISSITGGLYFRSKNTDALRKAYEVINRLEPVPSDVRLLHPVQALYPWPLMTAIFFILILPLTRRFSTDSTALVRLNGAQSRT